MCFLAALVRVCVDVMVMSYVYAMIWSGARRRGMSAG